MESFVLENKKFVRLPDEELGKLFCWCQLLNDSCVYKTSRNTATLQYLKSVCKICNGFCEIASELVCCIKILNIVICTMFLHRDIGVQEI